MSSCPNELRRLAHRRLGGGVVPADEHGADRAGVPACSIRSAFRVFSVFTTNTSGNCRCTCSPSESAFVIVRVGGIPFEKSSGFEMSTSGLPERASAPGQREHLEGSRARGRVDHDLGAGGGIGVGRERHVRVVGVPRGERRGAHGVGLGAGQRVPGVAGPTTTVWPSSFSRPAIARPTVPVPRTADVHGCSCESGGG